jgi:hypothetical protein
MSKIPLQFLMESAANLGAQAASAQLNRLRELLLYGTLAKIAAKGGPEVTILMNDNDKANELLDLLDEIASGPPLGPLE